MFLSAYLLVWKKQGRLQRMGVENVFIYVGGSYWVVEDSSVV